MSESIMNNCISQNTEESFDELLTNIQYEIDCYLKEVEEKETIKNITIQNGHFNKSNIIFDPLTSLSDILTQRQFNEIHFNLPYYIQILRNYKLLYSTEKHGISMKKYSFNLLF